VLFDDNGKELREIAPTLAKRFYLDHGPRYAFDENLGDVEKAETKRILQMARGTQSSGKSSRQMTLKKKTRCPRCC
jgi:hypothetical protein